MIVRFPEGTPRPSLPSAIYADDDDVLAGIQVRPGIDRSVLSRFGDDLWDISPAMFRANARPVGYRIAFARIDDLAMRRLAKEYILARLRAPLPSFRARCGPSTAVGILLFIRHFAEFVRDRIGNLDLGKVDQPLLDAYHAHVRDGGRRSVQQSRLYIETPIDLHHFSPWLTGGGISVLPWGGRTANHVSGRSKAAFENMTPRIPEPVISALLRWSLRYIDVYAADILAAREELDTLDARCSAIIAADARSGRQETYRARVAAWLESRRAAGRGAPVWERPPNRARRVDPHSGQDAAPFNYHLICLHVGSPATGRLSHSVPTVRLLERAAREHGTEVGGLDTPISIDPDTGLPWRARFDATSLPREERMLQAACYIICAYLTGMRDSEVQDMQTGCVSIERSADGLIDRYRVSSTVYKRRRASGAPADWITIEPVARAVAIMEALSRRAREGRNLSSLWVSLKQWAWTADHLASQASPIVNAFRDGLDAHVQDAPAIPHVDGKPWRLTTRQFRRTIAWYIANRPFGTVAGKIQYKHASVAIFEGYAGSSHGDFRRAVERERALGQLDDVVAHYEAYLNGEGPAGPGSGRLKREFAHVRDTLGDLPGHIMDRRRLRSMLVHLGRTLHVGFLNDCFFDVTSALCLTQLGDRDRAVPILSRCSPDRCPNACLTTRHAAPWQGSIDEGDVLMQSHNLSPHQRTAIERDNDRKHRLIAPLTGNKT